MNLDVLDVGNQTTARVLRDDCIRCQGETINDQAFCVGCTAYLAGTTEEDPAEPTPAPATRWLHKWSLRRS